MAEKELMNWLITVLLPVGISTLGILTASRKSASDLEHRLTKLEVINEEQRKSISAHERRLEKHDDEQKTMKAMVQQIKNLSEDIRDFKQDLKEIKEKIK